MPAWKGIVGRGFRPEEFRQYVGTLAFTDWRPRFVVVHNTSAPRLSQWHSTPGSQRMLNLQSYYRDQLHWSAGPHLFVADDLIWVFTPLTVSGVHSPSWNGVSWGVEIVGEFEDEAFSGAIKANAVDALATLHQWRGLDPQSLRFHKEDPLTTHTTCPGAHVVKADLIAAIEDQISGSSQGEHPAPAAAATAPIPGGPPGAGLAQLRVAAPAPVQTVTVRQGKRYQATVTLSFFEQLAATDATIVGMFSQLGFTDITISGTGGTRTMAGLWPKPDATFPLDPHVSNVVQLT
jgi:hypothetical protein